MNKVKMVLLAMMAVFAFSVVAASSASAAHQWLRAGSAVTTELPALIDGLLLLHHQVPAILGGGEITVHCTGQFHGTVNPNGLDKITDVLGLSSSELNIVKCEVSASSNGTCRAGTAVSVEAVNLPWHTLLELVTVGGKETVVDHLLEETGKVPGYKTTCNGIGITCELLDRAQFLGNTTGGSTFTFLAELKAKCTDGGTGTVLGQGELLGFQVS